MPARDHHILGSPPATPSSGAQRCSWLGGIGFPGQAAHDNALGNFDQQAVAIAVEMISHRPIRKAVVLVDWLVWGNADHPACAATWAMLPADNNAIASCWIQHKKLDRFSAGAVVVIVIRVAIFAERVVAVAFK